MKPRVAIVCPQIGLSLIALIAAGAPAQTTTDRSPEKAHAFIKMMMTNDRSKIELVNQRGEETGRDSKITSIYGTGCQTTVRSFEQHSGRDHERSIDWSKVSDVLYDYQNGFGYYIRVYGVIRTGSGATVDRASFASGVDSAMTSRLVDAMNYLQQRCDSTRKLGF